MNKRLISLLLVLVLIITLLPMSVFAVSNAKTVKASDVTNNSNDEAPTEAAEQDVPEPLQKGNPEGEYTVTVLNDANGPVKYKITYLENVEEVTLAAGQSCIIGVNEGDAYGAEIIGAPNARYKAKLSASTFECGEFRNENIKGKWSHVLGEGFKNGKTETHWYYTKDDEKVEVNASDVDSTDKALANNFNYHKSAYVEYSVKSTVSLRPTYTFTNTLDGTQKTGKNTSNIENEIKNEFISVYGEPTKELSSYLAAITGFGYYIVARPVTKEVIELYDECPANDVTLTFTSTVTPRTGGVEVRVYGPDVTAAAEKGLSDTFLSDLGTAGSGVKVNPDVVLKLTEKETNEGYEAKEYVLKKQERGLLDTYDTYRLDEDEVLIGEYTLTLESVSEAGLSTFDGVLSYDVEIEEGKIAGTKEGLLDLDYGIGSTPSYNLLFGLIKGFYLKTVDGFCFKKVDVAGKPVEGATFLMVNRDQTLAILDYIKKIGQKNYETIVSNMRDPEVFSWQEVISLHTQILTTGEDGNIALNFDVINRLFTTYLALFNGVELMDEEAGFSNLVLPVVLQSTSDASGIVRWNPDNNHTVGLLVEAVTDLIEMFGQEAINMILSNVGNAINLPLPAGDGSATLSGGMLDLITSVLERGEGLADTIGYNTLKGMGIVGEKLPAGHYILFEKSVPMDEEGNALFLRNPMYYTVNVEWKNENWVYASVANLGLILPYIAEHYIDFYEYLRNNNLVKSADKALYNTLSALVRNDETDLSKYESVFSDIVNGKTDVTASMITLMSQGLYQFTGARFVYKSADALASDMMKFMYAPGRTAQNLLIFANDVATRQKAVITGELNENWYFYNLEASIFKTWQKRTKTIADKLDESIIVGEEAEQYDAVKEINEKAAEAEEAENETDADVQDGEENTAENATGFVDISAYKDLNPNRWYYEAVKWALTNKVMVGVTETDFRTATPVTRGMVATVLYAAADYPSYTTNSPFSDVSKLRYFYNAVGWAAENGIVEGYPDGTFKPDKTISRQELAQMLEKYCDAMGIDFENAASADDSELESKIDFNKISEWAKTAVKWVFKIGAMTGLTKDTIDPLDTVTRAQLAQMIYKIMTNRPEPESIFANG